MKRWFHLECSLVVCTSKPEPFVSNVKRSMPQMKHLGWDGMGWDGMGWEEMRGDERRWEEMRGDEMGWDKMG